MAQDPVIIGGMDLSALFNNKQVITQDDLSNLNARVDARLQDPAVAAKLVADLQQALAEKQSAQQIFDIIGKVVFGVGTLFLAKKPVRKMTSKGKRGKK